MSTFDGKLEGKYTNVPSIRCDMKMLGFRSRAGNPDDSFWVIWTHGGYKILLIPEDCSNRGEIESAIYDRG